MTAKTMLQQVMTGPKEIQFQTVALQEIQPGQVLLKIIKIGVCGSDIHVFHGKHPYVTYPLTQGHEVSAQVITVGKGVRNLHAGQKVTVEPQAYCGACHPCQHGKYNLCENLKVMGFQTIGTASDYFIADATKVTALHEAMSYDEGAMIEPLAVTVHACKRVSDLEGKKVLVLGAGPIGNLLCQSLKAFGAKEVMVTDISDFRLDFAKKLGVSHTINTSEIDLSEALVNAFGEDKADYIFDCAGNDITINQAIHNARKGSKIVLVAVFDRMAKVDLAKLNDSEIDLCTSMMYRHEDYLDAIEFVEDGRVQLSPLISKRFSFKDYTKAYSYIEDHYETTMKVMIDVGEPEVIN